MSEYQYYEFRAVDRLLTQVQMDEMRTWSSRARISPDSFVNVYNWGDFKGDPDRWMEEYFDAFLYLANWGTRMLKLRVPTRLLDPETAGKYCTDDSLSCSTRGDHLIFSFHSEEEDSEWDDGEGWLASLVQLRSDLMQGDYRSLYIGWLLAVQGDDLDDDTLEPPLPPGLGALNAPLQSLADFLRIDPDLIAAAAEASDNEPVCRLTTEDISRWVAQLPSKDKDAVIMRLLEGDHLHIAAELKHRALSEIRGQRKSGSGSRTSVRRSVGQLMARREVIEQERRKREARQRALEKTQRDRADAEARKKHLESLRGKESALWVRVDELIASKHARRYDEAVSILKDLQDLADMQGTKFEFAQRMSSFQEQHTRKAALVDRFRKAKLLG